MKAKVQNLFRKNFLEKERERELIMQSPRSNIILNPIHHRVKCKYSQIRRQRRIVQASWHPASAPTIVFS